MIMRLFSGVAEFMIRMMNHNALAERMTGIMRSLGEGENTTDMKRSTEEESTKEMKIMNIEGMRELMKSNSVEVEGR